MSDGTPVQNLNVHNGKGSNLFIDPGTRKIPRIVGPYMKDNEKLDVGGSILTFPELETMGLKDLMNTPLPAVFRNIKNSGADVQVFKNPKGMIVGRVIKQSTPDK